MNILIMTIPVSITLGVLFLVFFLSAVSSDQYDDLDASSQLPLSDDEEIEPNTNKKDTEKDR